MFHVSKFEVPLHVLQPILILGLLVGNWNIVPNLRFHLDVYVYNIWLQKQTNFYFLGTYGLL